MRLISSSWHWQCILWATCLGPGQKPMQRMTHYHLFFDVICFIFGMVFGSQVFAALCWDSWMQGHLWTFYNAGSVEAYTGHLGFAWAFDIFWLLVPCIPGSQFLSVRCEFDSLKRQALVWGPLCLALALGHRMLAGAFGLFALFGLLGAEEAPNGRLHFRFHHLF